MSPIQSLFSGYAKRCARRNQTRRARRRPKLELLEDRVVPSVYPNDPEFSQQWLLHNTGQTGGSYDADIDAPAAWSVTTGSMATVVSVLDDGVNYADPDLYLNIWLNEGEIPTGITAALTDSDGDGLISFRDLNAPANAAYVSDVNANGYIDGGDVLNDSQWENGLDDDGNGKLDDLVGWDFHDNDNDPNYSGINTHGTDMSKYIGAIGSNGVGKAGVNWAVRLMPVRVQSITGLQGDRVPASAAAGLDYAVAEGAAISNATIGDLVYYQEIYDAIDRARQSNHLVVVPAGNLTQDIDTSPFYPAAYDLNNIIAVAAVDAFDQFVSSSNYGVVNVDLGAPSPGGGTSGPAAHVSGVAGLLKTLHPEWSYSQIRTQILATVDPLPSLAGMCVTGGRLNAAKALGVVYSTKFYVPNDGPTDQPYEYDGGDELMENYALTAANTAPRGAASNAAGDKVWVVDANKKVYVYNTSGGLLGSWTAGSLSGTAQVQGIATNGTDIWIVDAKQDKVFRYTGAASRLSGSQNAASSFTLNKNNKSPKDIVTDGTSLWVVNDTTTDKVFKYTLAGSLLGSWTISGGGGAPTGITLDPTNVNHLWIVDNGTDRVYQYDNAAGRTSGSQSASTSFALAAGNTNPQGIADPPAVVTSGSRPGPRPSRLDATEYLFALDYLDRELKSRRPAKLGLGLILNDD